ncbi:MAG: TlpA disulfide reductase family protein [Myxococcota bacterium]
MALASVTACSDPDVNSKLGDLEARIQKLEETPRAAARPGQADPAEEQAAANILKEATQMAQDMNVDGAKAKLAELSEKYGSTRAARAAQRLSTELEVVGKDAVPLDVEKWFNGSAADVEGGKATLYVFWEVWCPHCKREVPKLAETYDKFKGKGLSMVGLTKMTRNITEDEVSEFIKEKGVNYPIAKEKGDNLSQHYGVRGIPAAAMVKDGKVVWRGHPARLTDDMITKYLGA